MTNRHHLIPGALILVALLTLFGLPSCADDNGGTGEGDGDAGGQVDAGRDSDNPGADDGWAPSDPGYDAGFDAGSDPGIDAGYDAGSDPGDQGSGADICDTVEMNADPITGDGPGVIEDFSPLRPPQLLRDAAQPLLLGQPNRLVFHGLLAGLLGCFFLDAFTHQDEPRAQESAQWF